MGILTWIILSVLVPINPLGVDLRMRTPHVARSPISPGPISWLAGWFCVIE
ncbi:hypothetical protein D779_2311 [Imhoffiella purpurea]|uniref:Uncharacterized protein n=1 Tax=Imhoffiella purpurea TaxID=1249627 RepID=W9VEZ9_9GAMM|nr:hypothetical protein D779_2311 [Imhoffiella purpurea]